MTSNHQQSALIAALDTATTAIRFKSHVLGKELRGTAKKQLHLKLRERAEERVAIALVPVIEKQIKELADELKLMGGEKSTKPQPIIQQAARPEEWTKQIVDAALPVMALEMARAVRFQFEEMGVNVGKKGVKHAKHNQLTHGRGHMSAVRKDADGNFVMEDGSPLPSHIPRIPPAWENVTIAEDASADLLVKGTDAKGRSQSIYSEAHWAKAAQKKFARTNELRQKEKQIRQELLNDMRSAKTKEEATCLLLIQRTGIRPGGEGDTKAAKQAYGATTLQGQHVVVDGSDVRLKYTGKKGVERDVLVTDSRLKADLIRRKKKAGDSGKLFNTDAGKLLRYSKSKDGGGFKTKDFRTARGTSTAIELMKQVKRPKNMKEYKKAVREVAKGVAERLGNTPAVALQSYIDPTVFSKWRVK